MERQLSRWLVATPRPTISSAKAARSQPSERPVFQRISGRPRQDAWNPAMASLAGAGILQFYSARRCARQNRWLTAGRISPLQNDSEPNSEPSADDNKMPDEVWRHLSKVSKTLWPLLMRVAEAEGADLGGNADAFSRAAKGLATWQDALGRGTIWKDEKGANWPAERGMRNRWQDLLINKGLPQLVRRYPKLIDPLLEAFGSGTGASMSDGFSLDSGDWHDSVSWLQQLAKILRKSPELRDLIRKLGRRSAVRGPLHKLPEEIFRDGAPDGVIRSPAAPAESSGVTLAGTWDTMLPSEAQLLAAKVPMLRSLHHSRRIEQSLLCYDRSAWLEDSAKASGRFEMRPLGEAGPLIVCLDTSGSMSGQREVLSKALVVECVRQAHRQNRPCYLYAFSGMGDLLLSGSSRPRRFSRYTHHTYYENKVCVCVYI
ncbi:viaA [Symbiodinium sp. CCMP2592]|nr:viaA [Symbiodinium sp. CCMP2592]